MSILTLKSNISKKNFAAYCEDCGEEYSTKRKELGYTTCLNCGETKKTFPIAPAFNKGAYTVVTWNNVKDVGR